MNTKIIVGVIVIAAIIIAGTAFYYTNKTQTSSTLPPQVPQNTSINMPNEISNNTTANLPEPNTSSIDLPAEI